MNTVGDLFVPGDDRAVEVDFDYQPPERMTWDYPGCPESFDLIEARWEDGRPFTEKEIARFESEIIEALRQRREELNS